MAWNGNGLWLLTASRDQTCSLTDVRTMRAVSTFRDHDNELTAATWHPTVEDAFVVGTRSGSLVFWSALECVPRPAPTTRAPLTARGPRSDSRPTAELCGAHQDTVWDLAFDPHGHVLASASNDKSVQFWSEQRPGDKMNDPANTRTRHDAQGSHAARSARPPHRR